MDKQLMHRHKLNKTFLGSLLLGCAVLGVSSCSKSTSNNGNASATAAASGPRTMINIALGDDVPTLDPQLDEDTTSSRVGHDLFEGLTSFDQSNQVTPGLASSWQVSPDGLTYIFKLRSGLKFSDGSTLTAADVVFTWQRLVDPKTASPYNSLAANVVNGQAIIDGKLPANKLAVQALDANTIQIKLVRPDGAFLTICSMPNLGIVPQAIISKFGAAWTDPKNMVTSGAYKLDERVVKGHVLASKNPYYYAESQVSIAKIKYFPIQDTNSQLSQYKSGDIDITDSIPNDQYKAVKAEYPTQAHTVPQEALYYYDFNMTLPKYKDNLPLRQALSMAVDRDTIVKEVLGQGQSPSYSYVTKSIEGGKYADLSYPWATWPRAQQIAKAQELFKQAGYGPTHPLTITINYNTLDSHKKIALAIASMWQEVFGAKSIQVNSGNMEWKTFIDARNKGNYDIARDGWVADYDSVDTYSILYQCKSPLNRAKYCSPEFDKLILAGQNSTDEATRVKLTHQAYQGLMQSYSIIPLYQYTYSRLVSPQIKNYNIDNNHLDHVQTKWFKF